MSTSVHSCGYFREPGVSIRCYSCDFRFSQEINSAVFSDLMGDFFVNFQALLYPITSITGFLLIKVVNRVFYQ